MTASCRLLLLLAAPLFAGAQDSSSSGGLVILTGTVSDTVAGVATPTGTYQTFSSRITLGSTSVSSALGSIGSNGTITSSSASSSSTSDSVTMLTGSVTSTAATTMSGNFSRPLSSTTTAAPQAVNTQPCNNYPELCTRRYSNVTEVACHNSPFVRVNNAAANQALDVTSQLNDGVRFLQAQIQWRSNDTVPHFCHTSCDLLDAGPITEWLGQVRDWVASHRFDVVTILLGNGNYSAPDLYVPHIEASGITQFIYSPPYVPMRLEDWPTLGEMILQNRRVVMFLDYQANETAYPWLMDEFSQMWETPFDPLDASFPCTVQRPPNLDKAAAQDRLYLMNHNLNVEASLLGNSLLVPATTVLNTTNAVSGNGSLGLSAAGCLADWGRAPNFLNVDYYNYGNFPGSVFQVAAQINNVTYARSCCGGATSAAPRRDPRGAVAFAAAVPLALLLLLL